jgi:alpha-D-ribose 1-methylphosphonate 5-triphosphate synthase subunit PhnL
MNATETKLLAVRDLHKSFTLHNRSGIELPVLSGVSLDAFAGECLVLAGPSGAGKSTAPAKSRSSGPTTARSSICAAACLAM